jgi:predicted ATPase with chaperone activity
LACSQQNRQHRGGHQNDHQRTPDHDERPAHEQRIRRFAHATYRQKQAWARRFADGDTAARQVSEVCDAVVLALAWTLADLAGRSMPVLDDVNTALSFRQAGGAR